MTRRYGTAGVLMLMLAGLLVSTTPGSALAATPRCQAGYGFWNSRSDGQRYLYLPVDNNQNNQWRCLMSKGGSQSRAAVEALQEALNICYHDKNWVIDERLVVDGSFGSRTKAALTQVQQYHGIKDDGVYGPETASTMAFDVAFFPASGGQQVICLTIRQFGQP